MADEIGGGEDHGEILSTKDETLHQNNNIFTLSFFQKLIAEFLGTYFMVFAGCGVVVVDSNDHLIGQTGIAIVWGLVVMVMVYTVGHISGAHFNPAVTIAFAYCKRFPIKNVPYMVHSCSTAWINPSKWNPAIEWKNNNNNLGATIPAGSNLQSLVLEFIITFYLMFVISGVATDDRAIGEISGLAIGSTILLNAMFAGPISGASMNPARTLGPAIVSNQYRGLWIYILGPITGAIAGAWSYNIIRFSDKPLREIIKSSSFLQRVDAWR